MNGLNSSSAHDQHVLVSKRRLEGKVAIITGGASGIGAATAKLFLHHGAKVIIGDIQDKLGLSLISGQDQNNHNSSYKKNLTYVHCDVTNDADVKNLIDTAISKHGKLDIMYNNAGTAGKVDHTILDTELDSFKHILDINLIGCFLGAKHAARVMIPAKKGAIMFTSSLASVTAGLCHHSYSVSKVAVVGLMKSLCVELGKHGIRVNCVSPSAIPTPLLVGSLGDGVDKEILEQIYEDSTVLKGAVAREEDVAEAVLYLGSDEARVVSGHNLVIDGGYSTTNLAFNNRLQQHYSSLQV